MNGVLVGPDKIGRQGNEQHKLKFFSIFRHFKGMVENHRNKKLIEAIEYGYEDENKYQKKAESLIRKVANINFADKNGETVLMRAINLHRRFIAELLIESGADVNAVDNKGKTALMYSTYADASELLINHGANVNAMDNRGKTVLMYNAWNTSIVELLINHGANLNAIDNEGKTALMYSTYADASELLINHGADVNAIDKEGRTALTLAKSWNVGEPWAKRPRVFDDGHGPINVEERKEWRAKDAEAKEEYDARCAKRDAFIALLKSRGAES